MDPQPWAEPVRPALPPWRAARIKGFDRVASNHLHLEVTTATQTHHLRYRLNTNQTANFDWVGGDGRTSSETYSLPTENVQGLGDAQVDRLREGAFQARKGPGDQGGRAGKTRRAGRRDGPATPEP